MTRTITLSIQQLLVTGAVFMAVLGFGRDALGELRSGERLASCQSVAEGIRRLAISELAEQDEVTPLALNPPLLPESGLARLDPEVEGWGALVRRWDGEVSGQFSLELTETGFVVEARCVPRAGEVPVRMQGDEDRAVRIVEEPQVGG